MLRALFFVVLSVMMCWRSVPVYAQSIPAAIDLFVDPGVSTEKRLTLSLDGDAVPVVSIEQVSFDQFGAPMFDTTTKAPSWILLNTSSTNGNLILDLVASPSKNVSPGLYTVALDFFTQQHGQIAFDSHAKTLVFISVGTLAAQPMCLSLVKNSDSTMTVRVKNSGQGILYDESDIVMRGLFGIRFASAPGNPSQRRVLPGQEREWQTAPLVAPWWAIGPRTIALESSWSATCEPISGGFGWIPLAIISGVIIGVEVLRQRMARHA